MPSFPSPRPGTPNSDTPRRGSPGAVCLKSISLRRFAWLKGSRKFSQCCKLRDTLSATPSLRMRDVTPRKPLGCLQTGLHNFLPPVGCVPRACPCQDCSHWSLDTRSVVSRRHTGFSTVSQTVPDQPPNISQKVAPGHTRASSLLEDGPALGCLNKSTHTPIPDSHGSPSRPWLLPPSSPESSASELSSLPAPSASTFSPPNSHQARFCA